MNHFLDKIRQSVEERVKQIITHPVETSAPGSDFCALFADFLSPVIIAEIKFASPSLGVIYQGSLTAVEIAKEYIAHGASALSILTEPHFFKGSVQTIKEVRAALPDCPILLKDFVISTKQIDEAVSVGASAVLLIAGFLGHQLKDLYAYAQSCAITPLIEIHTREELDSALALDPKIIGINNRNLNTLKIDLNTAKTLIPEIPCDLLVISESGIRYAKDINTLFNLHCDGFLIGSHCMQETHPGLALAELLRGVEHAKQN